MIPTINKMGYMMQESDPYRDAFIEYAKTAQAPLLDIGAAYGIATIAAIKNGATVIANDLEPVHLEILQQEIPQYLKSQLRCYLGHFPSETSFESESLSGVLIAQVMHFLTGNDITEGLNKIYQWLKPGGKIFVVTASPYMKMVQKNIPIYEQKKALGNPWPGLIFDMHNYYSSRHNNQIPNFLHFMDQDILNKVVTEAGFVIEKISTFSRIDFDEEVRLDGRENVGVIAVKP
jgi:SAM-dependent methyltransferase